MGSNWTREELAYFAGIIDGEGCICLRTSKSARKHIFATMIQISNTDLRLLQWVQRRFGGMIHPHARHRGNRKPSFQWAALSDDIASILEAILPYMIVKREQAELMLAYRKTLPEIVNTRRSSRKMDESTKVQRLALHSKFAELNKRGAAS